MTKFSVYSNDVLVGHSALELGDAPMGVAFGVFHPIALYEAIRGECSTNHQDQSNLHLTVRTEAGLPVPCVGVGILDYSIEAGEPYIEVNVLGISYPLYEELFPEHVASYKHQFGESS